MNLIITSLASPQVEALQVDQSYFDLYDRLPEWARVLKRERCPRNGSNIVGLLGILPVRVGDYLVKTVHGVVRLDHKTTAALFSLKTAEVIQICKY